MNSGFRLTKDFFVRDVLEVAPELISKVLVIRTQENSFKRFPITETEAYRGTEDLACHASRGRTRRTEVMYNEGGKIYVYFVYGMYWMLNVVTGEIDNPQAVLIRGIEGISGPGRLTRAIGIDGSFYGEDLTLSERIWIEDKGVTINFNTGRRIGIDYAGEPWKDKLWRYYL
ncbi:MAG: 3-methyladenine DNA glycosylase [Odoribacter sp.]|nr:3-methyladenine DNA glycosylase [Odoribacter sp.]